MAYPYHRNHKIIQYQRKGFERNEAFVTRAMKGCDPSDINAVKERCHDMMASEFEASFLVKEKKSEIAIRDQKS